MPADAVGVPTDDTAAMASEPNRHQAVACAPPGAAFFCACLKVARAEDAVARSVRRAEEEAAAFEARALDGSWVTVFPMDGVWPKESQWARLHGVVHSDSGFAFASSMALKQVSRRMTTARRTRKQGRRGHAVGSGEDASEAVTEAQKAAGATPASPLSVKSGTAVPAVKRAPVRAKKPAAIKTVVAANRKGQGKGADGAGDGSGRAKAVASPKSVMVGGGGVPAYVAPDDMSSLTQVAKSIEVLLTKAMPRAQGLPPSCRAL